MTGQKRAKKESKANSGSEFDVANTFTLEDHCTRKAQSSSGGCSQRVHKIEYLAVNKGNILVIFLLLKIFIANKYHLLLL